MTRTTMAALAVLMYAVCAYLVEADPECPDNVKANPNNSTLRVFGGSCLEFVPIRTFWAEAKKDCESRSGRLVEIKTPEMQNFTYTTAKSLPFVNLGMWIGIDDTDKEGSWVYSSSGQPLAGYANWAIGQPACYLTGSLISLCIEDCGLMDMDEYGQWNDQYCHLAHLEYTYVCEYVLSGAGGTQAPMSAAPPTTASPAPLV